jgi:hypothetical protein
MKIHSTDSHGKANTHIFCKRLISEIKIIWHFKTLSSDQFERQLLCLYILFLYDLELLTEIIHKLLRIEEYIHQSEITFSTAQG